MPRIENDQLSQIQQQAGILPQKFTDMHASVPVQWAVEQAKLKGEKQPTDPRQTKVASVVTYLNSLDRRHGFLGGNEERRERQIANYVIKPETVPESYFDHQRRIAREQGHGDIEITSAMREQAAEIISAYQKQSLEKWVDYLNSPDAMYPAWFRYFALQGVLQLGKYDKDKKAFSRRFPVMTQPYPELNREALAHVYDALSKKCDPEYVALGENIDLAEAQLRERDEYDQRRKILDAVPADARGKTITVEVDGQTKHLKRKDLERMRTSLQVPAIANREAIADRLASAREEQKAYLPDKFRDLPKEDDFSVLYAHALEQSQSANLELRKTIEGQWVKYDQGEDEAGRKRAKELAESLQGYDTAWCTAGVGDAEVQLAGGDFYVFYSKDESGTAKIPRVAIRMQHGQVVEVRGVFTNEQELEPELIDTAMAKLQTLPDGDAYFQKAADMKQLTAIEQKYNAGTQLSVTDLRFLYEIDHEIKGFGFYHDPRLDTILENRDRRQDLATVFNCEPEQVAFNKREMHERTAVLMDDFIDYTSGVPESLRYVHGDVRLERLWLERTGLGNLEEIRGDFSLIYNAKIDSINSLKRVGGSVFITINTLTSLGTLEHVEKDLIIKHSTITDLGKLQFVGGEFQADKAPIETLGKLKEIGGDLNVSRTPLKDLGKLQRVGKSVVLYETSLKSLGGLVSVGDNLVSHYNDRLEDFGALQYVGGSLSCGGKVSTLGQVKRVGKDFRVHSALLEDLGELQSVGGNFDITGTRVRSLGKLEHIGNDGLRGNDFVSVADLWKIRGKTVEHELRELLDTTEDAKARQKLTAMEIVRELERKHETGELLSGHELQFLDNCELINQPFLGCKERVSAIQPELKKRQAAAHFGYTPEQVAISPQEMNDQTIVFLGKLSDRSISAFPQSLRYVDGDVELRRADIQTLGNIESISGALFIDMQLSNTGIEDLGALNRAGSVTIGNSRITSLSNLEHVQRVLHLLDSSKVSDTGNLVSVGEKARIYGNKYLSGEEIKARMQARTEALQEHYSSAIDDAEQILVFGAENEGAVATNREITTSGVLFKTEDYEIDDPEYDQEYEDDDHGLSL